MTLTVNVCDECQRQAELIQVVTFTTYEDGERKQESGEWCADCLRENPTGTGESGSYNRGVWSWRYFVSVTERDCSDD